MTCRGTLPGWRSCVLIIFGMDADREEKVFGPLSDPAANVGLPATLSGGKHTGPTLQVISVLMHEVKTATIASLAY